MAPELIQARLPNQVKKGTQRQRYSFHEAQSACFGLPLHKRRSLKNARSDSTGHQRGKFATVCTADCSRDNDMLSASAAETHTPQPFTAQSFRDAIETYCANRISESTLTDSSCDTYSCAVGWIFREGAMVSVAWLSLKVGQDNSSSLNVPEI